MVLEMVENNLMNLSDYGNIKTTCRLMLADNDEMGTIEETLEVNDALQNATFKLLPNSKHPIEKVDVDLLVKEIVSII